MKHSFMAVAILLSFATNAHCQKNSAVFQSLLKDYEQSINSADTTLAKKIWAQSAEVSFINPQGTAYGWKDVTDIYKMFASTFTDRKLKGSNEKISVYGDAAWLTFEWVFDATFAHNKEKLQTKGRETQIWKKQGAAWKLVHVHYSGMPATDQRSGF
jgi:ketosteroid isomerase-like protein